MDRMCSTARVSRILSIRQPWAELVVSGQKAIEVRSWPTAYRGKLWIHAAKARNIGLDTEFGFVSAQLVRGAVIGSCDLIECFEFDHVSWVKHQGRHHNPGPLPGKRYGWLLQNAKRISPKPFVGGLGLRKAEYEMSWGESE